MRHKINFNNALILDLNSSSIVLLVTNHSNTILHIETISKYNKPYFIRKSIITQIEVLLKNYDINCIIFEKNKLFIDKIDRYPDPAVLFDIQLGFGVINSLVDKFYETNIKLLEIPYTDWYDKIMNKYVTYSIDLYKKHVLLRHDILEIHEQLQDNDYYKSICFSEVVLHDELMHDRYLINKGD